MARACVDLECLSEQEIEMDPNELAERRARAASARGFAKGSGRGGQEK